MGFAFVMFVMRIQCSNWNFHRTEAICWNLKWIAWFQLIRLFMFFHLEPLTVLTWGRSPFPPNSDIFVFSNCSGSTTTLVHGLPKNGIRSRFDNLEVGWDFGYSCVVVVTSQFFGKVYIAPANWWLEDYLPIGKVTLFVLYFGGLNPPKEGLFHPN